jgi:hypothetical protein
MRLASSLSFAVLATALLTACSSSSGGNGGGGTGGSASTTSGSTSTTSGSTSTGTGTGSGCVGDSQTWASLTAGPFTCTQNSDCCVIVNGCTNEAQIVSATNQAAAKAAWPTCENLCTDCIPPAIKVGCVNGVCAGEVVPFPDASADLLQDHCGVDAPVPATPSKLTFHCGD